MARTRIRRGEALLPYVIIVSIVTLAIVVMHTYLRRSIQAKVKDLADNIISDRQLASLNDPDTEKSTKDVDYVYSAQRVESAGGASDFSVNSAYSLQMEHEVENLDMVDYGQVLSGVSNPDATYLEDGGGLVAGGQSDDNDEQSDDSGETDGRSSGGGL